MFLIHKGLKNLDGCGKIQLFSDFSWTLFIKLHLQYSNALVVTVLYTNQLTLIVSFSIATSLVRWSFSNWRLSICALISGLVSLACCLVLTTSSSNWRTSIACFWKKGIRTTFSHFVSFTLEDKTFDSKWIQSHTFIRVFLCRFHC